MRDEAQAAARRRRRPHAPIIGADRSAEAVDSARRNAERAGLAGELTIERRELTDARPTAERGLVLLNPPYGKRVGNPRTLGLLYREIGFVLRAHFRGWRAGVLVADRRLADAIRLPVAAALPLSNGGLRVTLLRYEITRMSGAARRLASGPVSRGSAGPSRAAVDWNRLLIASA